MTSIQCGMVAPAPLSSKELLSPCPPASSTLRVAAFDAQLLLARSTGTSRIHAVNHLQLSTDSLNHSWRTSRSQVANTEVSSVSSNPDFLNRTFFLRLPQPLGSSLHTSALLQANVFAAPSLDSPPGARCSAPARSRWREPLYRACCGQLVCMLLRVCASQAHCTS